jgi:UPF0271 protein
VATIDLNCDMGESFGAWTMGQDEAVMPLVSSANVACGFHAGDPQVMRRSVALARRHGVAIGAHVALPDLQGFGRREMRVAPDEAYAFVLYQLGALAAFAKAQGAELAHVKPHGALYNMAAREPALAAAIARAVREFDPRLVLFGLSGSALIEAGRVAGLAVAREAFADRRYESNGQLTPRSEPGAVIDDPDDAAAQLLELVERGTVTSRHGDALRVEADTICVHGDRPDAAAFARALRARLDAAGVRVAAPGAPS